MIKTEIVEINGRNLMKSYSDKCFKILQNETGIIYESAVDVENAPFTYSETDTPIESDAHTAEQLSDMSNAELKTLMADMGIGGTMNKDNMIALILSKQNENG